MLRCVSISKMYRMVLLSIRYHIHKHVFVQADAICVYLGLHAMAVTGPRCPSTVLTQVPVSTL